MKNIVILGEINFLDNSVLSAAVIQTIDSIHFFNTADAAEDFGEEEIRLSSCSYVTSEYKGEVIYKGNFFNSLKEFIEYYAKEFIL